MDVSECKSWSGVDISKALGAEAVPKKMCRIKKTIFFLGK